MRVAAVLLVLFAGACAATAPHPFSPTVLPAGKGEVLFSSGVGPSRWGYGYGPQTSGAVRISTGLLEFGAGGGVEVSGPGAADFSSAVVGSVAGELRILALRAPVSVVPLVGLRRVFMSGIGEWSPEAGVGIGLPSSSGVVSYGMTLRAAWRNAHLHPLEGVLQLTAQAGARFEGLSGRLPIFLGLEGGFEPAYGRVVLWPQFAIGYGF